MDSQRLSLGDDSSLLSTEIPSGSCENVQHAQDEPEAGAIQLEQFIHFVTAGVPLPDDVMLRIDVLAQISNILGLSHLSLSSFASAVSHLSSLELSLVRSVNRLTLVEDHLQGAVASMKYEQDLLGTWNHRIDEYTQPGNPESTATLERKHSALTKKAKEYHAQLKAIQSRRQQEQPEVSVTDVLTLQEQVKQKKKALEVKRATIAAFKGLPPNLELAQHELQNAREEQMMLFNLREKLLRRMATGVA